VALLNRARHPTHIAPSQPRSETNTIPTRRRLCHRTAGPCSSLLTGSSKDRHTSIGPWHPTCPEASICHSIETLCRSPSRDRRRVVGGSGDASDTDPDAGNKPGPQMDRLADTWAPSAAEPLRSADPRREELRSWRRSSSVGKRPGSAEGSAPGCLSRGRRRWRSRLLRRQFRSRPIRELLVRLRVHNVLRARSRRDPRCPRRSGCGRR
jgi:hypothetical protein